jgi:hypothetical protein
MSAPPLSPQAVQRVRNLEFCLFSPDVTVRTSARDLLASTLAKRILELACDGPVTAACLYASLPVLDRSHDSLVGYTLTSSPDALAVFEAGDASAHLGLGPLVELCSVSAGPAVDVVTVLAPGFPGTVAELCDLAGEVTAHVPARMVLS